MNRLTFLLLLLLLCSFHRTLACGTIKHFHSFYLKEHSDSTLDTFIWLQCEGVKYHSGLRDHGMLAEMINEGLNSSDECEKLLAVRSFFYFDRLKSIKHHNGLYSEVVQKIETFLAKPLPKIKIKKSNLPALNPPKFMDNLSASCENVRKEIYGKNSK
ncbi:MAG: hypothetical protein QX189_05055 [Methylococcales bacterium]